ncbi:3-oxoacyl-[acyl-carrier-protein] synthase III C-terminal domain-containing protein [Streptomyces sp. UNOC14_S4]|uniref:3-oxoacyl-[acyl-carrier-protein] synthase III C-terminal domain-containing protein n=1 Tax=Streptomyces sp. UNOC14_S4 TaxID=2872340 RepID=UPI001E29EDF6|nr:3-oxoacyl-[acyl-carrier-protein] synthase III C-terminal domain-containing protein [Streptomyces sp. UNOC14_S4]MCC3766460.1 PhlD [Streptomyces sp. UNOC14_S4]
MTPTYISRPTIALAPHRVTTDAIVDDIRAHHPEHDRIKSIPRHLSNTTVQSRPLSHPLDSPYTTGTAPGPERTTQALADAVDMGVTAARQTLAAHDLNPREIDALITSNSVSGGILPGLDVALVNELGLRPDIRRVPLTTYACAGGVETFIQAHDHLAARPHAKILIVISEPLTTTFRRKNPEIQSLIFSGLFGDSAGACLVTSQPLGPSLRIDDTWEYLLPGSTRDYYLENDLHGPFFDSDEGSLTSVQRSLPALREWVGDWQPDASVLHTGGPRIIETVSHALGLDDKAARHSYASLEEFGNLGGISVLDVLSRTHTEPPNDGDSVAVVGFGPGFTINACKGRWCAASY